MTPRQQLGNLLWIGVFCAALTSPFWGSWLFGLGVVLMAIAMELRKDKAPAERKPRGASAGPDSRA